MNNHNSKDQQAHPQQWLQENTVIKTIQFLQAKILWLKRRDVAPETASGPLRVPAAGRFLGQLFWDRWVWFWGVMVPLRLPKSLARGENERRMKGWQKNNSEEHLILLTMVFCYDSFDLNVSLNKFHGMNWVGS
mmetsp:Transcript_53152/g.78893  ORF Transcript_53152/g.78893 Transcript_53152/m.78893 type:complete len:134 (+) Transcript_53152:553-954(+)